jgi:FkbM family methyltransferase
LLGPRLRYVRSRIGSDYAGQRPRAIAREVYFRLARRFTPELTAEHRGLRFRVPTADRAMGLRVFAAGPPERPALETVATTLRRRAGEGWPYSGALLEIGANLGSTTVLALAETGFGSAICFEPLPANRALLEQNLELNGLADRATVLELVVSDAAGEVEFEISAQNSGDGRVRTGNGAGPEAFGESARQTVTVPATTLDALVERGQLRLEGVALAWLDVQGHEAHVLRGARALLDSSIPVVVELWPYALQRSGGIAHLPQLLRENFAGLVDLGGDPAPRPVEAIDELLERYGREPDLSTDLLLLR